MTKKTISILIALVILLALSLYFMLSNHLIVDGKARWLTAKPIIHNEVPYISLDTLAKLYDAELQYNKQSEHYIFEYLDNVFIFEPKQLLVKQQDKVTAFNMLMKNNKPYVSKDFIEHFFNASVNLVASNRVELVSKYTIPILMYHTVNERDNDTINTQPERFEEHIQAIVEAGYHPISSEELYRYYYHQEDLPSKPIVITFDDGYKDNYTNAYPILKKYNAKATIFTITSRIEHEGTNSYPNEISKLTWEDIEAMSDLIMVQSHTWDSHRKVDSNTKRRKQKGQLATVQMKENGEWETEDEYRERITKDIQLAQATIKQKTGYDSYILSYPYGESSLIVKEVAESLGVKLAVTVNSDINYSYTNLLGLKRITVDGNYTGQQLINIINELEN